MDEFERYLSQPGADTLQQPRSDLQSGAASTDQIATGAVEQSTLSAPQDQLNTNALRVGGSTVTVPNTTSTSAQNTAGQADAAGAFWWLIALPLLLVVLWLMAKTRPQIKERDEWSEQSDFDDAEFASDEESDDDDNQTDPEPRKTQETSAKPIVKKHHVSKKKRKSKKR